MVDYRLSCGSGKDLKYTPAFALLRATVMHRFETIRLLSILIKLFLKIRSFSRLETVCHLLSISGLLENPKIQPGRLIRDISGDSSKLKNAAQYVKIP